MNLLEEAYSLDKGKEYLKAIEIYEEIIADSNAPADAFINLSFLYWLFAAEFAFRDAYNIPEKWNEIGGNRYTLVLKKGLLNFPLNLELHFWSQYFPHRLYDEPFPPSECLGLIDKYGDKESLVPYFFLYLFDSDKYEDKRNALLIECDNCPTAKNEYIKSIIE